jgi:hypothetical protein
MASMHDLPAPAILSIINYAIGSRYVSGTNKYAAVCKAWRDVDANSTTNQLQLHLEPAARDKEEFIKAKEWIIRFGDHISALGLTWEPQLTQSLLGGCSNLRRLSISSPNSLVDLLVAKVQLPHLQHLTACMEQYRPWPPNSEELLLAHSSAAAGDVYPLQQACPGLVELHLSLDVSEPATDGQPYTFGSLEELLPQLLPPTLQQLGLRWDAGTSDCNMQAAAALAHLTALCHLGLWGIHVTPESLHELPPECSLQLVECHTWQSQHATSRMKALAMDYFMGDVSAIGQLTRLTSLALCLPHREEKDADPAQYLSHLTALQQLHLHADNEVGEQQMVDCLHHVTGLDNLSHLELRASWCDRQELVAAVGQLTQLSSLCLTPVRRSTSADLGDVPLGLGGLRLAAEPQAAVGGVLAPLQSVAGLRQLELGIAHILEHPTAWLSSLTQLTLLAVDCWAMERQLLPLYEGQPRLQRRQQVAAGCVAALAPRLQAVSFARLVQVVLYIDYAVTCEVAPSPVPGVSVMVQASRVHWQWRGESSCFRPMAPFLRLPGVWELLG